MTRFGKHKGSLTIKLLNEQIKSKGLSDDTIIAIGKDGEDNALAVVGIDIALAAGKKSGEIGTLMVLYPAPEESGDDEEQTEERFEEELEAEDDLIIDGINYEKAKGLSHQIAILLQNEPAKEIMISLCFSIARVAYKCISLGTAEERGNFTHQMSNLIGHFLENMEEEEPEND